MKRKEGGQGGDEKPEFLRSFNSQTRNMVENTVIEWVEKYYIDDSNLAVTDYNQPEQIERWVTGVFGRIKHQLLGSGVKGSQYLEPLAAYYLNDLMRPHKQYDKIQPHLPGQRAGADKTEARPAI